MNWQMNGIDKLILIPVLLILSPGPSRSQTRPMAQSSTRTPLVTGWQFREAGQDKWYPASVPGCVHTDLLNNKLIKLAKIRVETCNKLTKIKAEL